MPEGKAFFARRKSAGIQFLDSRAAIFVQCDRGQPDLGRGREVFERKEPLEIIANAHEDPFERDFVCSARGRRLPNFRGR